MANLTLPVEPLASRIGIGEVGRQLGVMPWAWVRIEALTVRNEEDLERLDRLAIVAGCHPSVLWPDWFDICLAIPSSSKHNRLLPTKPLRDLALQDVIAPEFQDSYYIAKALDITAESVKAWGEHFSIRSGADLQRCDRHACRLGVLPFQLWPDWFDLSLEVPMVGGDKANPKFFADVAA